MTLDIKTNNVPRDLIYWHDLTAKEQAEFDYLDTDEKRMDARFFRYRGNVYDLAEFMALPSGELGWKDAKRKWDGYHADSYFSGILVDIRNDEQIVVGTYYS